jgi:hypothetical protein
VHVFPKPSFIAVAFLFACEAHWLTRKASAEDVATPLLNIGWGEVANIKPRQDIWPMLLQYFPAKEVILDVPFRFETTRLFQAEF